MISEILLKLGNVYKNLGEHSLARTYCSKALTIYEKYYGKDHVKIAPILRSLGQVDLAQGYLEAAETFFNKALKIFEFHKHPDSYKVLEDLAELYLK
jgi:tetratricopeptide (TPR) repeat protein